MRTIAQLLALTDFDTLSKADRWQIFYEIDQQIDHLQKCQKVLHDVGLNYDGLTRDVLALRNRKAQVYLSFYPKIRTQVRMAA